MYLDGENNERSLRFTTGQQGQAEFIAASIRDILGLELGEYAFYLATGVPPIRKTPADARGSWRKYSR